MPSIATILIGLAALSATAIASLTGAEVQMDMAKRAPAHRPQHRLTYGDRCSPKGPKCYSGKKNAKAFCNPHSRRCDISCPRGFVKKGDGCAPRPRPHPQPQTCTYDHNCKKTNVLNAQAVCLSRHCTFACDDGFYNAKGRCVPVAKTCGQKKNHHGAWIPNTGEKCTPVEHGYNVCVDNHCVPRCETSLGYSLFTDDEGNYRCVNLVNDPYNCGEIDNVCEPGYNGLGTPICHNGSCSVNCHGYGRPRQLPNGQYYCSSL